MAGTYFCKHFPEGIEEQNFLLPDAKTHWTPSRDMILTHVYLDLEVEVEAKQLKGTACVSFSSIKKKLESIFLEARELTIDRVASEDGQSLRFKQSDLGVRIYFAEPVGRNQSSTVRVDYRVEDPRLGLYFTGPDEEYPDKLWQVWSQGQDEDNKYWFPCVDHPREKVTRWISRMWR